MDYILAKTPNTSFLGHFEGFLCFPDNQSDVRTDEQNQIHVTGII